MSRQITSLPKCQNRQKQKQWEEHEDFRCDSSSPNPVFGIAHVASKSGIAPVASESACQKTFLAMCNNSEKMIRPIGPPVNDMKSAVATNETNTVIILQILE